MISFFSAYYMTEVLRGIIEVEYGSHLSEEEEGKGNLVRISVLKRVLDNRRHRLIKGP